MRQSQLIRRSGLRTVGHDDGVEFGQELFERDRSGHLGVGHRAAVIVGYDEVFPRRANGVE